ncbi:unnamed protein product [Effrenium voratum]|nr:unnamed protein product [Effrenium voratum]
MSQHLFVAVTEVQWRKTTGEGALAVWALATDQGIAHSTCLPCWRSQEQATLAFFRNVNRQGLGVAEDDSRPIGPLPASGRVWRHKASLDGQASAPADATLASSWLDGWLLYLEIHPDTLWQLRRSDILGPDDGNGRLELYGALPLAAEGIQIKGSPFEYQPLPFQHWLDLAISPNFFYRASGRCGDRDCQQRLPAAGLQLCKCLCAVIHV